MVASTVSRASYGIVFQDRFHGHRHLEEDRQWDAHEGMWMAKKQMKWYLKRVRTATKLHQIPIPPLFSLLVIPSETDI